jgi:hypothetical protein
MNANELAEAMEIRASIRRKATSRKSVQENANDRLADQLEQAATMLRQQQAEIEALKQIIDANNLIQNIGQFVKPQEKCPPTSWWKGDPTCGGITENYGLGKSQKK